MPSPSSRRPDRVLYILSSLDFSHSISSLIIRDEVQYLLGLYRVYKQKKKRVGKQDRISDTERKIDGGES